MIDNKICFCYCVHDNWSQLLKDKLYKIKENFLLDNIDIDVWVFYDKTEKIEKISNNGCVYKYRWNQLYRQYRHLCFNHNWNFHNNYEIILYSFFKEHNEYKSYYVYDACCDNRILFYNLKTYVVDDIINKYDKCVRKSIMNDIVITMTSWKKRINNCLPIIKNILENQSLKPDKLYLNLSVKEFDNESKLPQDLLDYINNNENLILNLVPGDDTKVFKKVFPILKYLNDDDIILCIDDDIMYPQDYVESRVNDFIKHGCKEPISGHTNCDVSFLKNELGINPNFGGGCLMQKKMLNHYNEFVDDDILKTHNDDTCYAYLEYMNGYIPQNASKYHTKNELSVKYKFNDIEPIKNQYKDNSYLNVYRKKIEKLINKKYDKKTIVSNIFNFYNKKCYNNIIVTFTSWKQRINNCSKVIDSFLEQTLSPDIIYLNLSTLEFPNKEDDLPYGLMKLILKHLNIHINWVDDNYKCFKKVYPILNKCDDDDLILYTDDDIILNKDLIKSRVNDFISYQSPISGTPESKYKKAFSEIYNINNIIGSTATSIVKAKMLKGFEYIKSDELLKQYNDDTTYVVLCYLNGYNYNKCSDYQCYIDKDTELKMIYDDVPLSKQLKEQGSNYYKTSINTLNIIKENLIKNKNQIIKNNIFKLDRLYNIIKPSICIYCNVLNNKLNKKFPKIKFNEPNIDYYMFTDDNKYNNGECIDGWKIIKTQKTYSKVQDINKSIKWNPWNNINTSKYDYIIYMDSKIEMLKPMTDFVMDNINKLKHGFGIHTYKFGTGRSYEYGTIDIYNHIDYLMQYNVGNKQNLLKWKEKLSKEKYPTKQGVLETCIILLDTRNTEPRKLFNEIFNAYLEANTQRDQIIVPYILYKNDIPLNEINVLGDYYNYSESGYFKNNSEQNVNGRC